MSHKLKFGVCLILTLIMASGFCLGVDTWAKAGSAVWAEDSKVYFSAEPHTLSEPGMVSFVFSSKTYSGNMSFVLGFDKETIKPSFFEIYAPYSSTETISYTCESGAIIEPKTQAFKCYTETPKTDNLTLKVSHINTTTFEHSFEKQDKNTFTWSETTQNDWRAIPFDNANTAKSSYGNMNTWSYMPNLEIQAGGYYSIRANINIPVSIGTTSGKYWACIFPSSYGGNIEKAKNDGVLNCLDPWYNTSYAYRRLINCTGITDGTPILVNGTEGLKINGTKQLIWTLCAGNETAIYYNNYSSYIIANTSLMPFEVERGNRSSNLASSIWSGYKTVWHFNESRSPQIDSSGTAGAQGNVTSAVWGEQKIGGGYDINVNQFIRTDNQIFALKADISLCYWGNTQNDNNWSIGFGNSAYMAVPFGRADTGFGVATKITFLNWGGEWRTAGDYVYSKDTWYWICAVKDEATLMTLYINGIANGTNAPGVSSALNRELSVGKVNNKWSEIKADEIRVYNGLLSAASILDTYSNFQHVAGHGNVEAQEAKPSPPSDSCTCAGLNTNWEVSLADHCNITTACDLGTGKLNFTGSGYFNCNATITTNDLGEPKAGGTIWVHQSCYLKVT